MIKDRSIFHSESASGLRESAPEMSTDFCDYFQALTGHSPMPWQRRLFYDFLRNNLPEKCIIPTGLGKTSVIPIWLIALVLQNYERGVQLLPRRLFYTVNRRTVVDQATELVQQMREKLMSPGEGPQSETLREFAQKLRALSAVDHDDMPLLAVSTLRGELADNEEWKADPARPAIIIGTIDMIGSKLLFQGYGDARYGRAHHAGLVGQDALIVHDEAHLTPAFGDLLRAIASEQSRELKLTQGGTAFLRPIKVIELSATSRQSGGTTFTLDGEDEKVEIVQERLNAIKRLHLHPAKSDKELVRKIIDLAKKYENARVRVLIYVNAPTQARKIVSQLGTGERGERVATLTGTIRGYERDQLVSTSPVYRAFLEATPVEKTVYLVSTSAGEVGLDLDADHLVCDLTPLDSLIQRLGRVNRRGGRDRQAQIDVVLKTKPSGHTGKKTKSSDFDNAIEKTADLLNRWIAKSEDGLDVSPASLNRLLSTEQPDTLSSAFSPTAKAPPLTDVLLDAWSLTSIQNMPGRREVGPFLHGWTQDEPEIFVAWRQEISLMDEAKVDGETLGDWFRICPIRARERLRDTASRVKRFLSDLLTNHRNKEKNADFPVVLLSHRGEVSWSRLSEVVQDDDRFIHTIILPVEAGGLDQNGMLDPSAIQPNGQQIDVAEVNYGKDRSEHRGERWLHYQSAYEERYERLLKPNEVRDNPPPNFREKGRIPLTQASEEEGLSESRDLVWFVSDSQLAVDDLQAVSVSQTLTDHHRATARYISDIAERLRLPDPIRDALIIAAQRHDTGKGRPIWQHYANNHDSAHLLAKSKNYLHPRVLGGYRHELGSLLDALSDKNIPRHPEGDLILHLIAAHHGWARPYFDYSAFDNDNNPTYNEEAVIEAMRRFGRLQRRFGRWGLAWLESILRCADIAASMNPSHSTLSQGSQKEAVP